jgi:hypothetical protein
MVSGRYADRIRRARHFDSEPTRALVRRFAFSDAKDRKRDQLLKGDVHRSNCLASREQDQSEISRGVGQINKFAPHLRRRKK